MANVGATSLTVAAACGTIVVLNNGAIVTEETHSPSDGSAFTRRGFVGVALAGGAAALSAWYPVGAPRGPRWFGAPFPLEELTIPELQQKMVRGPDTARSLAEQYLGRIEALDKNGPALREIIELNPVALSSADGLDTERRAGKSRGPLHGIPVLIKDNIATADQMQTTAGSLALVGAQVPRDAFVVERLRMAGAVILGKTNLSEWANFRSTHSSSGWSARGGQARNPYALDRTPSGSSSGTGGAIAANFAAVGVGTETDGSITSPAAASALVGIKPTVGLISRNGIVPIAHSQDTAGPMARTVTDAAILLGVLAGMDARDAATEASRGHTGNDYTRFLDPRGLSGARIGIARERYMGYSRTTDSAIEVAIDVMRQNGATIIDPANITTAGKFDDSEFDVLLYEFKTNLNRYLSELSVGTKVRSLADIIAFNDAHASSEMPYFGQEILIMAEKKASLASRAYRRAWAKCQRLARTLGIDATFDKHRLDAIVAPTQGPPALVDLINGDPSGGGSFTSPAAVAGYPHITVPAGFVFGLPVGLSFVGRAWSEPTLIRLAFAYEQATKHRRPPQFLATAAIPGLGQGGPT
ncbi:MAG: amidase [Gemmatimonadaceae bacterium]